MLWSGPPPPAWGKRRLQLVVADTNQVHPRVRGENGYLRRDGEHILGPRVGNTTSLYLLPRFYTVHAPAWGIPAGPGYDQPVLRCTPTPVGKTLNSSPNRPSLGKPASSSSCSSARRSPGPGPRSRSSGGYSCRTAGTQSLAGWRPSRPRGRTPAAGDSSPSATTRHAPAGLDCPGRPPGVPPSASETALPSSSSASCAGSSRAPSTSAMSGMTRSMRRAP